MEIKRGELTADAAILARHARDAIERGAVSGKIYSFNDFGRHHAQRVRDALNACPQTSGRVRVSKSTCFPGWREIKMK